jgi:RNA polymerase sigma factor (sigma-70 family)
VKNSETNTAVRDIQMLFEVGTTGSLSDGQLLDRFVARHEEAVFEAIMQRHGSMVWGVCRRILRDHHDAEDAFQAAFLLLARKAASIQPREKVGNWLYGVAYQTARKARATRAKRRLREGQLLSMPERMMVPHDQPDALAECLDRELSRLPKKYRIPIALCELEGKTHRQAADQLGWPIGTVSARLSRARAMLAKRLSRPGLVLSSGSLSVLLAQDAASAIVPTKLIGPTAKAASLFAAKQTVKAGLVSAEVANLTGEMSKTMLLSKLKITTAILLTLALAGAGVWQARTRADGTARPDDSFRVTVNEVLNDDSAIVTQVGIETLPGSRIEVISDQANRGVGSVTAPDQTNGMSHTQIIIFADHVEWKPGSTNALKFMMKLNGGAGSSNMSNTGPMVDGKRLADVVKVTIRPSAYQYGVATKLVTFTDVTYSLVVKKPE